MGKSKNIQPAEKFIVTCPRCMKEIISPRGELNKRIKDNAQKIQSYTERINEINKQLKVGSQEERIELGKLKGKLTQELMKLNKESEQYKLQRQILAEHEAVSAYQLLKEVIVEKYGNDAYISCMDCVMRKMEKKIVSYDEMKVIEII